MFQIIYTMKQNLTNRLLKLLATFKAYCSEMTMTLKHGQLVKFCSFCDYLKCAWIVGCLKRCWGDAVGCVWKYFGWQSDRLCCKQKKKYDLVMFEEFRLSAFLLFPASKLLNANKTAYSQTTTKHSNKNKAKNMLIQWQSSCKHQSTVRRHILLLLFTFKSCFT